VIDETPPETVTDFTDSTEILTAKLDSSRSPQVPPPRQCYSPGGVTIFGFAAVPLMPPLTQW